MRIIDWSSDVCSSDLGIGLLERSRRRAAGVGYDDVRAGDGVDGIDQLAALLFIAYVAAHEMPARQSCGAALSVRGITAIDDDPRTLIGQRLGAGPAQSAGSAQHQRGASL